MSFKKIILFLFVSIIASSCEDSPKGVGVYSVPTNQKVVTKIGALDEAELKVSIFNLGNFGDETSATKRQRALNIERLLADEIFTRSDVYVFLDIVDKENQKGLSELFKIIQYKGISCAQGVRPYEQGTAIYTVVCYHPGLTLDAVKKIDNFYSEEFQLENSVLPAHGINISYKASGFKFNLVMLDFSRALEPIGPSERERYTKELVKTMNEKSEGLATIIVGDWRNKPNDQAEEESEMEGLFNVLNNGMGGLELFEAEYPTVIDTDTSNPVFKKYNNLIFSSDVWGPKKVENLGACNKPNEKKAYRSKIGENCATIFTLKKL